MARRVGGLVISRKVGEFFRMDYPDGSKQSLTLKEIVSDGASVCIGQDEPYLMMIGDSIGLPGIGASQSGIYLESIEGGRCAFRIIADDKIRVFRGELLRN
jgi:hypothetical protein